MAAVVCLLLSVGAYAAPEFPNLSGRVVDGKNKTGPTLNGVMGRAAAAVEGFKYSKAFVAAAEGGLVWDEASMAEFLAKPKAYVPKTKMSFVGLKKDADIEAIIAYLAAQTE